jgi:hypothetical protein
MFYRNISGLMLSDLIDKSDPDLRHKKLMRPGLGSRLLLTGSVLAAPFIALGVVLFVQGLLTP